MSIKRRPKVGAVAVCVYPSHAVGQRVGIYVRSFSTSANHQVPTLAAGYASSSSSGVAVPPTLTAASRRLAVPSSLQSSGGVGLSAPIWRLPKPAASAAKDSHPNPPLSFGPTTELALSPAFVFASTENGERRTENLQTMSDNTQPKSHFSDAKS